MKPIYFLLIGTTPRPATADEWAQWFEVYVDSRQVAQDVIGDQGQQVCVSTVFLGLDHGGGDGPPVLWETMIFGGPQDGYQTRYTSHEAALKGHEEALALAQAKGDTGQ